MNGYTQDKVEMHLDIERMKREAREEKEKRKTLKEMELFVLDNSLRESTVGQLRGHTIENKWKIYEQVSVLDLQYFDYPGVQTISETIFDHGSFRGYLFKNFKLRNIKISVTRSLDF